MQCLKNGLALCVVMRSGVDRYKRMYSRSSGSSKTLAEALLGRLNVLKPVSATGSSSCRRNQLCVSQKYVLLVTNRVFLSVLLGHFVCCNGQEKRRHVVEGRECLDTMYFS
jgi:hypothetical protein